MRYNIKNFNNVDISMDDNRINSVITLEESYNLLNMGNFISNVIDRVDVNGENKIFSNHTLLVSGSIDQYYQSNVLSMDYLNNSFIRSGKSANCGVIGINNEIINGDILYDIYNENFIINGVESNKYIGNSKIYEEALLNRQNNLVTDKYNIKVIFNNKYMIVIYYALITSEYDKSYISIYKRYNKELIARLESAVINDVLKNINDSEIYVDQLSDGRWLIFTRRNILIFTKPHEILRLSTLITNSLINIRYPSDETEIFNNYIILYFKDRLYLYNYSSISEININNGNIIRTYDVEFNTQGSGKIDSHKIWHYNDNIYLLRYVDESDGNYMVSNITNQTDLFKINMNIKMESIGHNISMGNNFIFIIDSNIIYTSIITQDNQELFNNNKIAILDVTTNKLIILSPPSGMKQMYYYGINKNNLIYLICKPTKINNISKIYTVDLNNFNTNEFNPEFNFIKDINFNMIAPGYYGHKSYNKSIIANKLSDNVIDVNGDIRDYNATISSLYEFNPHVDNTVYINNEIYKLEQIYDNMYNKKRRF